MGALKTCFLFALVCLVVADDSGNGLVPPGPPGNTTQTPPTSSTSTSTTSKTTTTSPPPTTTSTTSSTSKPTTTTSTAKPTTTSSTPTTTSSTSKPTTTSSTSKPTTTSGPTPKPTTPAPVDPVGTWFVNYTNTNRTCLLLKAELSIDIYYKVDNATKNITVNVASNAVATGLCGALAENITLSLGAPDAISFNLKKSNDSKRYDVESVIVLLTRNVPGRNDSVFTLAHAKDEFSTPVSSSYKCAKEQKLNLTAQTVLKDYEGVLRVSHFQIQAFRNASSTKFDEALDCASSETPDVVPIAVGCALAALVVIVLIAYLIGRRRSQARGYLSMFAQNKREEDYIPMKNLSCFN